MEIPRLVTGEKRSKVHHALQNGKLRRSLAWRWKQAQQISEVQCTFGVKGLVQKSVKPVVVAVCVS